MRRRQQTYAVVKRLTLGATESAICSRPGRASARHRTRRATARWKLPSKAGSGRIGDSSATFGWAPHR